MRRTPASSELTAKQRYCLTTGSGNCCSGGTGPAGPAGPAGPGVACGTVYSGITVPTSAGPVGPPGTYLLQITGSVLFVSVAGLWANVRFLTPIYFFDTVTGIMYYAESDNVGNATVINDTGLLIGCRDRNIYHNVNGVWDICCNISPQTASITGAPVNINSMTETALMTTSINHGVTGMNAQLTASVYLTGFSGNTGQGYLYLSAAGVTGTKFPYTSGTSFPETYTIAETFTGLPTGSSTVGLYGNNTGITATGAGNLSVLYNLTPT